MAGPAYHGRTHGKGGTDPIPPQLTIEDEGTPLTQRDTIDFVGAGVTVTDDAGNEQTVVTIPGGGGSGGGALIQPGHRLGTTEDRWYAAGGYVAATLATNVTTGDRADAFPFIPSRDMTLDAVFIQITGGAAGNMRVGLYTDDGNLYPDALLLDTGNIATNTTGVKQVSISQAVTAETFYWAVCAYSANSVQMRSLPPASMMALVGYSSTSGTTAPTIGIGWRLTHAFGALPDPFTAGADVYTTSGITNAAGMFFHGVP